MKGGALAAAIKIPIANAGSEETLTVVTDPTPSVIRSTVSIIWRAAMVEIVVDGMSRQDLLDAARATTSEIEPHEARALFEQGGIAIDVREGEEVSAGQIPGALSIPRGFLELRIEGQVPNRQTPLVVYCASGTRSLLAASTLRQMGYERLNSLAGGFDAWKAQGLPWRVPPQLTGDQKARYRRHLLLPSVGETGQLKLLDARVLLIGAGGLGSPCALYLAAAGIGHLGVVDPDVVDRSNLQRQILHRDEDAGRPKVESAVRAVAALNPDVEVVTFEESFNAASADRILDHGWDVVVDGCDNFSTRYIINDACVRRGLPNVHGSIYQFEGQVGVFSASPTDPCYRCLYPAPPPPEFAPNCAEAGVLGVLPGVIGTTQALETLKLILGIGEPMAGRLDQFDAMTSSWRSLRVRRDPKCPACGDKTSERSANLRSTVAG